MLTNLACTVLYTVDFERTLPQSNMQSRITSKLLEGRKNQVCQLLLSLTSLHVSAWLACFGLALANRIPSHLALREKTVTAEKIL